MSAKTKTADYEGGDEGRCRGKRPTARYIKALVMKPVVRAKPSLTPMHRGRLPAFSRRHVRVDGPERPSGRNASPSGITPSNIMSPAPEPTRGSRTEVRPGARAHNPRTTNHAHAPPAHRSSTLTTPDPTLDAGPLHK